MDKLNISFKLLVCGSDYDRACFPLAVCVCVWRRCQSCDSNHEAGSDPARSLSASASFSSQGIFGIVVSDTLIVMGRPGCQWSAWISILLGSASRASATWCNRSLSCLQCRTEESLPANTSSGLSLTRSGRRFFFPWWSAHVTWAPLAFLHRTHIVALNKLFIVGCQSTVTVNTLRKGDAF